MKIFLKTKYLNKITLIIFLAMIPYISNACDCLHIKNGSHQLILDLKKIEKMNHYSLETTTPWTQKSTFEGISMSELTTLMNMTKGYLRLEAIDDYWVIIPYRDIKKYHIILAYKMNGAYLDRKTFGPFFIVYPYDEFGIKLNKPIYHSRSIWQVKSIEVYDE